MPETTNGSAPQVRIRVWPAALASLLLLGLVASVIWGYYTAEKPLTVAEIESALNERPQDIQSLRTLLKAEAFPSYSDQVLSSRQRVGATECAAWYADLSKPERARIIWLHVPDETSITETWMVDGVANISDAYLSAKPTVAFHVLAKADGTILGWLPPK